MSPGETVHCSFESCGRNITKSSGSISCKTCLKWFHANCVAISTDQLTFLLKSKGKFGFICDICSTTPPVSGNTEIFELRGEIRDANNSVHQKLDAVLTKINNFDNDITALKHDVNVCNKKINNVDESYRKKIKTLEDKNEILQSRFNKADIIISGLPRKELNLKKTVINIFKILNGNVSDSDLNVCCFINNRHSVLIKLNSVLKRNMIMRNYFKKGSLKQSEVFNNNSGGLIYLNDHLTEKGGKLCKLCRTLRKDKVIEKFRMLNSDLPRVKIHLKDNSERIFEYEECLLFFNQENLVPHNSEQLDVNLISCPTTNDAISTHDELINNSHGDELNDSDC